MNPFGSYRALLNNAIAAAGAAIEIYNKPRMAYREECFVILLVNGWELMLKALLSKNRRRIYYKKRRQEPYRTLSVSDALTRSEAVFPTSVPFKPTAENLRVLIGYRDAAIHFYNKPGFGAIIYALAQTSVNNFRDVVQAAFSRDIASDITLSLLPLTLAPPVDPVEFLKVSAASTGTGAVEEFSRMLRDLIVEMDDSGEDTGRLLTTFSASLVSMKKVAKPDVVVGVAAAAGDGAPAMLVNKPIDPNKSHPYREIDIVGRRDRVPGMAIEIDGIRIGQHQFRALVHAHRAKEKIEHCWTDDTGAVTRYSQRWVDFIQRLRGDDVREALRRYRNRQ